MRRLLTDAAATRHQFIDLRELASLLGIPELPEFKENMSELLGQEGFDVNEGAAEELVAHIAVMVDRVRMGHPIDVIVDAGSAQRCDREDRCAGCTRGFDFFLHKSLPISVSSWFKRRFPLMRSIWRMRTSVFLFRTITLNLLRISMQLVNDNYLVDLGTDRFIGFLALHSQPC